MALRSFEDSRTEGRGTPIPQKFEKSVSTRNEYQGVFVRILFRDSVELDDVLYSYCTTHEYSYRGHHPSVPVAG